MVKGILKRYSRPASSRLENDAFTPQEVVGSSKKRVSFDDPELVKVFEADEWDHSPAQVTLKLMYKDVAKLRELNVSLIKPVPLAMIRTKSKRPTPRSSAPQSPPLNSSIPSSRSALVSSASPCYTPVTRPSSPISGSTTSFFPSPIPLVPSTQPLPRLLEDQPCSPTVTPTVVDDGIKDDEFEGDSSSSIRSPPGLSVRGPNLDDRVSPTPPSPLHAPSLTPCVTSSKPSPTVSPSIPLYRPPHLRAKLTTPLVKYQDNSVPSTVSAVTRSLSEKVVIDPEARSTLIRSEAFMSLKASELIDLDGKAESVSLILNKECDKNGMSTAISPIPMCSRRSSRSLMGWELKRSVNAPGKLGFGLVRKQQPVGNDVQK